MSSDYRINTKLEIIKKAEKFKEWDRIRKSGATKTKNYRKTFQQGSKFDAMDTIRMFYRSKEVKKMVETMVVTADAIANGKKEHIPDSLLHEMNQIVPILPFMTAGNRPELFGNITRGQFENAIPDCANPNKPLHCDPKLKAKPEIMKNIVDGMYVNPNPSNERDPLDRNPPQDHPAWKLGWLQGYVINAPLHKTGHRWDLFVFLPPGTHFILRMYADITSQYLARKGKLVDHKTRLFVNRDGGPLITSHRVLDFSKLREITGTIMWQGYSSRHLFTDSMYRSNDAMLIECESFYSGHLPSTATDSYVSQHVKMMKARVAHHAFQEMLGLQEEASTRQHLELVRSKKQEEESGRIREGQIMEKKADMLIYRRKVDGIKAKVKERTLTDTIKVALLELIDECDFKHRHFVPISLVHQDVIEAFLGDKTKRISDFSLHKLLLNMLDTCPETSKPRKILENHLIQRSRLKSDKVDKDEFDREKMLGTLELEWTNSLLESLDTLGRGTKASMAVVNPLLSEVLEKVAIRRVSEKFCLGSEAIRVQIKETLEILEEVAKKKTVKGSVPATHHQVLADLDSWRLEERDTADSEETFEIPELVITSRAELMMATGNEEPKLVKPHTPIKFKFRRIDWNDRMKCQVLR